MHENRKSEHPECPCCTCGKVELSWSDRISYVFYDDEVEVANCVVHCALDHSYDRTPDGVPYGVDSKERAVLAAVVAKFAPEILSKKWDDPTRESLKDDFVKALVEALRKVRGR